MRSAENGIGAVEAGMRLGVAGGPGFCPQCVHLRILLAASFVGTLVNEVASQGQWVSSEEVLVFCLDDS